MTARRGLFLPFLLIGVGIIALLANVGVISPANLDRLGDLWPLIVVLIGAEIVINRTLPPRQADWAGVGVLALLIAIAVAYVGAGSPLGGTVGEQTKTTSAAVGDARAGELDVSGGGFTLKVTAADSPDLYQATFRYPGGEPAPQVVYDPGTGRVQLSFGSHQGFHLFGVSGRHELDVQLSSRVEWNISLSGGGISASGDLTNLPLAGMDVSGGAAHAEMTLGAPRGTSSISFSGGAFDILLHMPADAALRVHVSGGANAVTVADQTLAPFGDASYESPGYAGAADHYDVEVSGGASHVRITR